MEASNHKFPQALTFNDVLLVPGYSDFSRSEIDLSTQLTRNIKLKIPFVSAPMDTVTESKLAIALAKMGGIGIIHRNLSVENQAREVEIVKKRKLLAGAAIGPNTGFEERAKALIKANVDVIVVDSAHGFTKFTIDTIKYLKRHYPKLDVIAGNIATYEGARRLINAGADGLRVGMGPGAICTTRVISGMGVPQITAILETTRAARSTRVPIIADGGLAQSGDMVKALAAGASTVMMGSFFASTSEAPGRTVRLSRKFVPNRFQSIFGSTSKLLNGNGKNSKTKSISITHLKEIEETFEFKEYRGMGSEGAMQKGSKTKSEGEFHGKSYKDRTLIAEGVEGLVPVKGALEELVEIAVGGIKSGFYYCGAKTISEMHKKANFVQITQQSLMESHPHDILVTNAGKSYS
jgi:IMP dehydrogenase